MLGYPFDVKGYKLYDLEHKIFFCNHNVIFRETIFPFKDSSLPPHTQSSHSVLPSAPSDSSCDFPLPLPEHNTSVTNPPSSASADIQLLHDSFSPLSHPYINPSDFIDTSSSASPSVHTQHISPTSPPLTSSTAAPQRSSRAWAPPTWLKDFFTGPQPKP